MATVLAVGPNGRNRTVIGLAHSDWPSVRSLASRGLMTFVEWATRGLWDISVTTAGAREVVRAGAMRLSDLAIDVDPWLARLTSLIRYRDDLRARFGETCAAELSCWQIVRDEPYARVAVAILLKRGLVEPRGPGLDPRELTWTTPDALFIRAVEGHRQ
ncbi:MAG: hypothetical protein VX661_01485 [Pseudomonadota bacterium]|nr:hypothetical protein [Pseudomonadota bacterium]